MAPFYCLGPWLAPRKDDRDGWHAPEGTVGLLDLRALDGSGVGFFATDAPLADSDYTAFGDGKATLDAIGLDDAARKAFAGLLGIDAMASATLLDAVWDAMTIHADPEGATRTKPLMPTSGGAINLHLAGFKRSQPMAKVPTDSPHWDKIQRVIHADCRAIEARCRDAATQKERDLYRRWLGFQSRKYALDAAGCKALLIPADLAKVDPLPPETTITDNFNRSGSTLGANWTTRAYFSLTDELTTDGSVATPGAEDNGCAADHNTALSGDDHYVQAVFTIAAGDNQQWVTARRIGDGTVTHYEGGRDVDAGMWKIRSAIAGVSSTLGSYIVGNPTGVTARLTVDGSDLVLKVAGVDRITVSDANITGNLYCGLSHYDGGLWDDFEAADLAAAFSTALFRENAGLGAAGGGGFARANAGLGGIA